jgi:hypothetical protein
VEKIIPTLDLSVMTKSQKEKKKVWISLSKLKTIVWYSQPPPHRSQKLCRKRNRDKVLCTAFIALFETVGSSRQRVLKNGSRKAAGILHTLPLNLPPRR